MLELEAGILKLSRKDYVAANRLSVWLASVDSNFAGRVLSFDRKAASVAATILNGRTRGLNDCLIAGIAISNGLTLATRNTKDFDDIDGLTVVNPWEPK
jgi:predicted nucleic acid-binding protein